MDAMIQLVDKFDFFSEGYTVQMYLRALQIITFHRKR